MKKDSRITGKIYSCLDTDTASSLLSRVTYGLFSNDLADFADIGRCLRGFLNRIEEGTEPYIRFEDGRNYKFFLPSCNILSETSEKNTEDGKMTQEEFDNLKEELSKEVRSDLNDKLSEISSMLRDIRGKGLNSKEIIYAIKNLFIHNEITPESIYDEEYGATIYYGLMSINYMVDNLTRVVRLAEKNSKNES